MSEQAREVHEVETSEISSRGVWDFFTNQQWCIFAVLIVIGLLQRWIGLEVRPLHHDESLHAMWGKYFFDHPSVRFYKYDPMLHGPLLYNTLFFTYFSLGDSEWSARFPAAVIGSFGMLLPLLFRKFFTSLTVLLLTGFIAVSPTLVYWSRFIRHDPFVLLGIFTFLYGVLVAKGGAKAYLVSLGLVIQFCAKENSYVHMAIFIGYLIFEPLFLMFFKPKDEKSWGFWPYITQFWPQVALSFAGFCFIYAILFGAWFLHPQGILDGLYAKSIMYWWEQSSMERIKGPFMFHYYVLAFYETIFLAVALIQLFLFYRESPLVIKISGIVTFVLGLAGWAFYYYTPVENMSHQDYLWQNPVWKFLKLKHGFDVLGCIVLLVNPVLITAGHLLRGERTLALAGYSFGALFFSYSYLGEKVPWLTLYPFIAGLIYLSLYFQSYFQRNPIKNWKSFPFGKVLFIVGATVLLFGIVFILEGGNTGDSPKDLTIIGWLAKNNLIFAIVGVVIAILGFLDEQFFNFKLFGRVNLLYLIAGSIFLYSVRASYLTNYVYGGNERELLSQVHTTYEALDVVDMITYEVKGQPRGYQPHVYVSGDAVWPMTWYFRKLPTYDYLADEKKRSGFLFRIENWKDNKKPPLGFTARRINLRGWWLPDYNRISLKRLLHYAINHEPWNPPGFAYVNLYYRNNPEGQPLLTPSK